MDDGGMKRVFLARDRREATVIKDLLFGVGIAAEIRGGVPALMPSQNAPTTLFAVWIRDEDGENALQLVAGYLRRTLERGGLQ